MTDSIEEINDDDDTIEQLHTIRFYLPMHKLDDDPMRLFQICNRRLMHKLELFENRLDSLQLR